MATTAAHLALGEGTPPASPGPGLGALFFDAADGQLYFRRSDTGAIVGPLGAGGGGAPSAPTTAAVISDNHQSEA